MIFYVLDLIYVKESEDNFKAYENSTVCSSIIQAKREIIRMSLKYRILDFQIRYFGTTKLCYIDLSFYKITGLINVLINHRYGLYYLGVR